MASKKKKKVAKKKSAPKKSAKKPSKACALCRKAGHNRRTCTE
jgi:hypothetical protein